MSIQIVDASNSGNRRIQPRSLAGARTSGDEWVRPAHWPPLPPVASTEQKFVGLVAATDGVTTYVALTASGAYTVNWGDGTVTNYSAGAQATYTYNDSSPGLTATPYGYRCAIVTITPQSGQNLTALNLNQRHPSVPRGMSSPWLDIVISMPNCSSTGLVIQGSTSQVDHLRLQRARLLNIGNCTNLSYQFQKTSVITVDLPSTANVTTFNSMFYQAASLRSVPLFSFASATGSSAAFSVFYGCSSLRSLPAFDLSTTTSSNGFAQICTALARCDAFGARYSFHVGSTSLQKAELETVFTNLGKAFNTSQTITIGGAAGTDTAVSKSSCGTTTGSTTVTQSNTSSLAVGMICTGTGISDGVAVTFQDSGDTVTRTAHGLANGTMISFSAITSTTGISTYTPYYVVNATSDTFQVAATPGGAALPLTTDGSGTLLYPAYITAISTNVSVTLSAPASATGTATLSFRILDTFKATCKGWVIG